MEKLFRIPKYFVVRIFFSSWDIIWTFFLYCTNLLSVSFLMLCKVSGTTGPSDTCLHFLYSSEQLGLVESGHAHVRGLEQGGFGCISQPKTFYDSVFLLTWFFSDGWIKVNIMVMKNETQQPVFNLNFS